MQPSRKPRTATNRRMRAISPVRNQFDIDTMVQSFDDEPTVVSAPYTMTNTRRGPTIDERLIVTNINNIVLNSGQSFEVLDVSEEGEIHSISVVSDNPYLQVFLQVDDFRNREPSGETAAEILYNSGVNIRSERRFQAIDGQSPTVGYGLVLEPQIPIGYANRLRLILYNNVPSSDRVYGFDLDYRSGGNLPTPAVPAHMGGSSFEMGSLAAVSLNEMAQAITTPVGSPPYYSGQVYNIGAINGQIQSGMVLGSDHPYVGIAGKPIFTSDSSSTSIPKEKVGSTNRDAPYRLKIRDAAERFPGTKSSPSTATIDILPDIGEGGVLDGSALTAPFGGFGLSFSGTTASFDTSSAEYPVGKRFFYRLGGKVAFLGEVTAISMTHSNGTSNELIPSGGSSVIGNTTATTLSVASGSDYEAPEFHIQIKPGLAGVSTDFSTEVLAGASASNGLTETSEYARWGLVKSQADTDPHILVKSIEVRRKKYVGHGD